MGFLSKFEGKMEDTVEGMASGFGGSTLSPVQITKKAEKQMRREKIVGAGVQYAPTLYTVLVSQEDDARLFGYYPTLAGEIETYLAAKARETGLDMDGQPLVRFLADPELKRGKFDVVAEMVAAPIVAQLRNEEMQRYGLAPMPVGPRAAVPQQMMGYGAPVAAGRGQARPSVRARGSYVPPQPEPEPVYDDYDNPDEFDTFEAYDDGYADEQPGTYAEELRTTVMSAVPAVPVPTDQPLEVYLYDEARDRAYQLSGRPERIGRESANEIVVPDINVSRVHAEIRRELTGTWVITDLGSTNGVYVNGRQVKTSPLRDADMITLGTSELEFQLLS